MRSCLRRPLAPGRSRVRAILVSSVIFFSFSSAMVIVTYGIDLGGTSEGENFLYGSRQTFAWRDSQEKILCSATLGFGNSFRTGSDHLTRLPRITHPLQYIIHRVLNAGVRLVKLPCRLRHELAQQITVLHRVECLINKIGTH